MISWSNKTIIRNDWKETTAFTFHYWPHAKLNHISDTPSLILKANIHFPETITCCWCNWRVIADFFLASHSNKYRKQPQNLGQAIDQMHAEMHACQRMILDQKKAMSRVPWAMHRVGWIGGESISHFLTIICCRL